MTCRLASTLQSKKKHLDLLINVGVHARKIEPEHREFERDSIVNGQGWGAIRALEESVARLADFEAHLSAVGEMAMVPENCA